MAWAEPTAEVTSLTNWHTTQVCTNTQHDQPLRFLNTLVVRLGVSQRGNVDLVGLVDLVGSSVSDKHGLTLPLDNDVASLGNGSQLDLDLGHGQHISRGGHRRKESLDCGLGTSGRQQTHGADHEVGEVLVVLLATVVEVAGVVRLRVWRERRRRGGQCSSRSCMLVCVGDKQKGERVRQF